MKKDLNNKLLLKTAFIKIPMVLGFLALTLISCKKDEAKPDATCRVKSYSYSQSGIYSGSITYTSNGSTQIDYDEKDNILSETSSNNSVLSDGKTQVSNYSRNNQYNSEGYIIRSVSQNSSSNYEGTKSISSSNTDYSYENNKLIKETYSSISDGKANTYNVTYEYDGDGKIIKYSNTYNNSSTKYEYLNGKLSKIIKTDNVGNSSSPFIEVNSQGLITKTIETTSGSTEENRYEYDIDGSLIREERWFNSKPYDARSSEFDKKLNPYSLIYKKKKGQPLIPDENKLNTHNNTKTNYFVADAMGQWQLNSHTVNTNDYNSQNYLIDGVSKGYDDKGKELYSSRSIFIYDKCK